MYYANAAEMLIDANHFIADMDPSFVTDIAEAEKMARAAEEFIMDGIGNA
jgi:hypothetical protein